MSDPRAADPSPMPLDGAAASDDDWFRRSFGGDYLRVYRRRNEAAADAEARYAIGALGLEAGARVLDLACGAGRHSRVLHETGLEVTGLDLSRDLLQQARARLGGSVPLVAGDMRALPFASAFRAVFSFFTSFGYFRDAGEDRRVLAEMARVVVPGGGLFLDLPDRETTISGLVPESHREEDGFSIDERRSITPDGQRVEKEIVVRSDRGEERYRESVRLYEFGEIESALAASGWTIETAVGDFGGEPWRSGTGPRMICIARRNESGEAS